MNAVGYTRVSLDDQVEHGHSLAAQETLIREFAASRLATDAGVQRSGHLRSQR